MPTVHVNGGTVECDWLPESAHEVIYNRPIPPLLPLRPAPDGEDLSYFIRSSNSRSASPRKKDSQSVSPKKKRARTEEVSANEVGQAVPASPLSVRQASHTVTPTDRAVFDALGGSIHLHWTDRHVREIGDYLALSILRPNNPARALCGAEALAHQTDLGRATGGNETSGIATTTKSVVLDRVNSLKDQADLIRASKRTTNRYIPPPPNATIIPDFCSSSNDIVLDVKVNIGSLASKLRELAALSRGVRLFMDGGRPRISDKIPQFSEASLTCLVQIISQMHSHQARWGILSDYETYVFFHLDHMTRVSVYVTYRDLSQADTQLQIIPLLLGLLFYPSNTTENRSDFVAFRSIQMALDKYNVKRAMGLPDPSGGLPDGDHGDLNPSPPSGLDPPPEGSMEDDTEDNGDSEGGGRSEETTNLPGAPSAFQHTPVAWTASEIDDHFLHLPVSALVPTAPIQLRLMKDLASTLRTSSPPGQHHLYSDQLTGYTFKLVRLGSAPRSSRPPTPPKSPPAGTLELVDYRSSGSVYDCYGGVFINRDTHTRVVVKICRPATFDFDRLNATEEDPKELFSSQDAAKQILQEGRIYQELGDQTADVLPDYFGLFVGHNASLSGTGSAIFVEVLEDVGDAIASSALAKYRSNILEAYKRVHATGVVHGDLALRHIRLLNGGIRLIDFGQARRASQEECNVERDRIAAMLDRF